MTHPDLDLLSVAADAAECGRLAIAEEYRAMVVVDFERTRHTHSTVNDLRLVVNMARFARRNDLDRLDWVLALRSFDDPRPRHTLPWTSKRIAEAKACDPDGVKTSRFADFVRSGLAAIEARHDYGHSIITPNVPYIPALAPSDSHVDAIRARLMLPPVASGDLQFDASGDLASTTVDMAIYFGDDIIDRGAT